MDDYILELPNFVPHDLCKEILRRFKNDTRKQGGFVPYGKDVIVKKASKELNIMELEEYHDFIDVLWNIHYRVYEIYRGHLTKTFGDLNKGHRDYDNLNPYIRETKPDVKCGLRGGFLLHEVEKDGHYLWHHDQMWALGFNFIQVIIYLNTLTHDEGGCTEFTNGRKVRPEIGKVLIYPQSWTFLHKGGKVNGDNTKYICTASLPFDV